MSFSDKEFWEEINKEVSEAVAKLEAEGALPHHPLLPAKSVQERYQSQTLQELEEAYEQLSQGLIHITHALNKAEDQDPAILKELTLSFEKALEQGDLAPPISENEVEDALAQTLGLNDQTLETLYQGAKACLEENRIEEAKQAFLFLVSLDPYQFSFWLGYGHSLYSLRDCEAAIVAYTMADCCDPESYEPKLYLANCYKYQGEIELAKLEIEKALAIIALLPISDENKKLKEEMNYQLNLLKNK